MGLSLAESHRMLEIMRETIGSKTNKNKRKREAALLSIAVSLLPGLEIAVKNAHGRAHLTQNYENLFEAANTYAFDGWSESSLQEKIPLIICYLYLLPTYLKTHTKQAEELHELLKGVQTWLPFLPKFLERKYPHFLIQPSFLPRAHDPSLESQ